MADVDQLGHIGDALFFLVSVHQHLDRSLLAPGLGHHIQLALVVDDEDGLDVQHGAHSGHRAADPAPLMEVVQIAHHEAVAHIFLLFFQPGGVFFDGHAGSPVHEGHRRQDPLALGGGKGVHQDELSVGEFLPELGRGDLHVVEGGGEAGGHTQIENVVAGFQQRLPRVDIIIGRDLGGVDLRALFLCREKSVAVLVVIRRLGVAGKHLAVDDILHRDDPEIILLVNMGGDIRRRIRENQIVIHSWRSC